MLNDAHDKVADFVLNGYANTDLNKIAIQKITGITYFWIYNKKLKKIFFKK